MNNLHCGHCEESLQSVEAARLHDCFLGVSTINLVENGALIAQTRMEDVQTDAQEGVWTDDTVNALITAYEQHEEERNNPLKKKEVWDLISRDLLNVGIKINPLQAKYKWWYLTKRYKEAQERIKEGRKVNFRFFERMEEVIQRQLEGPSSFMDRKGLDLIDGSDGEIICWSDRAINALLDAYENRVEERNDPKKRKKIWDILSDDLKSMGVKMTPQQVRWKWMYLTKRHKDATMKGDRAKERFRYFRRMDELLRASTIRRLVPRTISSDPRGEFATSSSMLKVSGASLRNSNRSDLEKHWVNHLKGISAARKEHIKTRQRHVELFERLVELKEREREDRLTFHRERMDLEERKLELLSLLTIKKDSHDN